MLFVLGASLAPLAPIAGLSGLQQGHLVGRVVDQSRRPLDAVEVVINRREVRAVTGTSGVFTLEVTPVDRTIAFRRIGYRPSVFSINPLPNSADTLLVQLEPSALQLAEIDL